jgi:hypothetical protein
MANWRELTVDEEFLTQDEQAWFVFGDNTIRRGYGGAAQLRDHPRAYGFITKKFPDNRDTSFYDVAEYRPVFVQELERLKVLVSNHPTKQYYISRLGCGLANRYGIWELVLKPGLEEELAEFNNVTFLWKN